MLSSKATPWMSLYFFSMLFVWGVFLPFWSLWLESKGLSVSEIGLLLGWGLLARFAGNLLIMQRMNNPQRLLPGLRWVGLSSLITLMALLWLESNFWLWTLTLLANFFISTLIPISDAIATNWLSQGKFDYGRVRVFGSIGFVVASTLVGLLLTDFSSDIILYVAIISMLITWGIGFIKPREPLTDQTFTKKNPLSLWKVLPQAHVRRFIIITALLQGSHAAYYAYGSLYLKDLGFSESTIGYLWGVGVICEMSVLIFGGRWFKRWTPKQMFTLAAIGGIVRWGIYGSTDELVLLVFAQGLHSLTFAVSLLAAIKYIANDAPSDQAISLQTLYSAISLNMVTALLTFLASALYSYWYNGVFLVMAGLNIIVLLILLPLKNQSRN